jgi:phage terminase large subunit-like protein
LTAEGLDVQRYQQGLPMSSPMKLLETLIVSQKLRHAGNPVLAWQMSNVEARVDSRGNIKPEKAGISAMRIDGAVALIMALGVASDVVHGPEVEPEIMVM